MSFRANLSSALLLTMRTIFDKWLALHPPELQTMLRFPMGWVDADGLPDEQPAGKQIRPLLLMLCTAAAGGVWQNALPAAAAVEILHNFSLVHDDIQDDSHTRRGRPTVWRVWGKPNAINVGDALFTLSYAALSELDSAVLPEATFRQIWTIFNQTNLELIRGQYLDMRFETRPAVTADEYISMITGKSAALIAGCAEIGALIGGASTERAQAFHAFGLNLGIAFQIRDDILGIWGNPALTGKSAATDILSRKKSLPVLHGLRAAPRLAELYLSAQMSDDVVAEVIQILNDAGASDYAKTQEQHYADQAMQALERAQPVSPTGEMLADLTRQLLGRAT
jgi:geranylgeranyl diphosphate synthase type I